MKRFLVFAWSFYEPYGGWGGFAASRDTLAEAHSYVHSRKERKGYGVSGDWEETYQIVDSLSGKIVAVSGRTTID